EQVRVLRGLRVRSVTHIRIPCWLCSAEEMCQEPTRRTRGFLFLAMGAAAVVGAGVNELFVYENGVGAINLPYERVPIGVPNSRAVHPLTLLQFSRLVSMVRQAPF